MDELYNAFSNQIASAVNYNNAFNAEQAQKQMDFQREMSNTAHVREIADLKAAGLNPVLSAKLGGASTPAGSSASADTSGVSAIASLATEFMRVMAEGFANGAVSAGGTSARSRSAESESGKTTVNLNPNTASAWYIDSNGQVKRDLSVPVEGPMAYAHLFKPNDGSHDARVDSKTATNGVKNLAYGLIASGVPALQGAGVVLRSMSNALGNAVSGLSSTHAMSEAKKLVSRGNSKADVSVMSYKRGAR